MNLLAWLVLGLAVAVATAMTIVVVTRTERFEDSLEPDFPLDPSVPKTRGYNRYRYAGIEGTIHQGKRCAGPCNIACHTVLQDGILWETPFGVVNGDYARAIIEASLACAKKNMKK